MRDLPGLSLVLIGDSGRDDARDALALAQLLAPLLGADLLSVRVVPERQRAPAVPSSGSDPIAGQAPPLEIRHGDAPARVLQEVAESRGAAMVVLGSSHRAGPGRILPGSVGSRLLQVAPCPVAIAPRDFAQKVQGEPLVIGVAFVDSPESRAALEFAARLGNAARAALRVVYVYQGAPPPERVEPSRPTAYEQAQDALRQAVEPLPRELRAEPRLREGDPVAVLVGESELGLDLLVMGSRGQGPVRRVLLGSVSEAVTWAAACPVIVVPRGMQAAGP